LSLAFWVALGEQQIPPLRCGMTNKKTGNRKGKGKSNGNSRSSAFGEG
jgi:hypothetical protein